MAQNEGRAIGQEQLEFAIPYLGIQKVYRCGVDANQHIICTDLRFGNVGQAQRPLLVVFLYDEGFHGLSPV